MIRFRPLKPVQAFIQITKMDSLSRVCLSLASLALLLFIIGCDSKSSLRAVGGKQNTTPGSEISEQKERLETEAHMISETLDNANALAAKASLEYLESTRAIAVLTNYLRLDESKRAGFEPEIKFIAAKGASDPFTVQIMQGQTSSQSDISSVQTFEVQAAGSAKGKFSFDKMKAVWVETVKLDQKNKTNILETRHEFNFQFTQDSEKVLTVVAKDAKVAITFNKEKVKVEVIADLSFKLVLEDGDKIVIKDLNLEKAQLTTQEKPRGRAPVLTMSATQNLQLQLKTLLEKTQNMSAICYDFVSGTFTSGDDQAVLESKIESNKVTLKAKSIDLASCPTANFIDAKKWIPSERKKIKSTNLNRDRPLVFE